MIVIPAIDLKEGKCVRLTQGRMDQVSVYSEDPAAMARHWEAGGAKRLHVVDLNGAAAGKPVHRSEIEAIVRAVRIPVEVGGGIRDLGTMETYLSLGATWVILGTAALQNRDLVRQACVQFPGKVILAIDARRGDVAIQGWQEVVSLKAIDLVREYEGAGISSVIFTDVERDGTGKGLNWEMTRSLARATSIPVIASGGVSCIDEIEHLKRFEGEGVMGVIVGRALYTGQIRLEEAIRMAEWPDPSAVPANKEVN